MKTLLPSAILLGLMTCAVFAQSAPTAIGLEDPIGSRKWLMRNNGAAAGLGGAIMKGEVPFSPAVAEAVFRSMNSVAYGFGHYFPEGSQTGDTTASPAIWERPDEFRAALAKFEADTRAGIDAKPQDVAAFGPLFQQAASNCNSCHEQFRLSRQ